MDKELNYIRAVTFVRLFSLIILFAPVYQVDAQGRFLGEWRKQNIP
jgi:hypothetical protein